MPNEPTPSSARRRWKRSPPSRSSVAIENPVPDTAARLDELGLERRMRRSSEDRVEEAREAGVEIVTSQAVEARGALLELANHARLAQNPKMMRQRRLGHGQSESAAAARRGVSSQRGDDTQPLGIAQRVQHGLELQFVNCRVMECHRSDCTPLIVQYGTMIIVL